MLSVLTIAAASLAPGRPFSDLIVQRRRRDAVSSVTLGETPSKALERPRPQPYIG